MTEHRYLFLVRQEFGQEATLDSFYKLVTPSGMTNDQMRMWSTLDPDWNKDNIKADTDVYRNLDFRLRANNDMYNGVCLVRSAVDISADEFELILQYKEKDELLEFLDSSKV